VTGSSLEDDHLDYARQTRKLLMSVVVCSIVSECNLLRLRDSLLACPGEDVSSMHDYDFRTPLHIAAKNGSAEIVRFLIQRGSKINALDRWQ